MTAPLKKGSGKVGGGSASAKAAQPPASSSASDAALPKQTAASNGDKGAVGKIGMTEWKKDDWREVEILEDRVFKSGRRRFYVHFPDFNRRLDQWLDAEDVRLDLESGEKARLLAKRGEEVNFVEEGHDGMDEKAIAEHERITRVKNVNTVELGRHRIDTWYFTPLPREYHDHEVLFWCEYCLSFFCSKRELQRHVGRCTLRHPPGDEIYRKDNVSMFEVDGSKSKIYCQNLSYFAKLFLDHKTLQHDVDTFFFYVMCELDEYGYHMTGYFSKEKESEYNNNLACILTLPPYQRKGYGKFLISFSYELSKKENKFGTPERPLSDLGLVSYTSFWTRILMNYFKKQHASVSIKEICQATFIRTEDIIFTLQHLNLIKYYKGQHVLVIPPKVVDYHLKHCGSAGLPVDSSRIHWTPHVSHRK